MCVSVYVVCVQVCDSVCSIYVHACVSAVCMCMICVRYLVCMYVHVCNVYVNICSVFFFSTIALRNVSFFILVVGECSVWFLTTLCFLCLR